MVWKTISSEMLINDPHLSIWKNEVELPGGVIIPDFYTVTIPDAAMIVALTNDNKIILKREYRYACKEELTELPAGMFDKNETDALIVAKRELSEETGYISSDWTYLGKMWESTSKLTNRIHLFLAKNCIKVDKQHLDETEQINVLLVPFEKAVDMVLNAEICDNSSSNAILRVAKLYGGL